MAKRVDEVMNPELFMVAPDDQTGRVRSYLLALGISACPVVDEQRRPVGFVSLKDLALVPDDRHIHLVMTAPANTIAASSTVEDAGRQMTELDRHHLACVDDDGRVVGFIGSLDVLRGVLGQPLRHPGAFPHYDRHTGLSWTDEAWLREDELQDAPDGPGLFALVSGEAGRPDSVVWSEACRNVKTRLLDLVAGTGRPPPHVVQLLDQGKLRYRAATAPSVRALREAFDAATNTSSR